MGGTKLYLILVWLLLAFTVWCSKSIVIEMKKWLVYQIMILRVGRSLDLGLGFLVVGQRGDWDSVSCAIERTAQCGFLSMREIANWHANHLFSISLPNVRMAGVYNPISTIDALAMPCIRNVMLEVPQSKKNSPNKGEIASPQNPRAHNVTPFSLFSLKRVQTPRPSNNVRPSPIVHPYSNLKHKQYFVL